MNVDDAHGNSDVDRERAEGSAIHLGFDVFAFFALHLGLAQCGVMLELSVAV